MLRVLVQIICAGIVSVIFVCVFFQQVLTGKPGGGLMAALLGYVLHELVRPTAQERQDFKEFLEERKARY